MYVPRAPACVSCIRLHLNITFYLLTQGPPGLAGAKGEKVSFLLKFLEDLVYKKLFEMFPHTVYCIIDPH